MKIFYFVLIIFILSGCKTSKQPVTKIIIHLDGSSTVLTKEDSTILSIVQLNKEGEIDTLKLK